MSYVSYSSLKSGSSYIDLPSATSWIIHVLLRSALRRSFENLERWNSNRNSSCGYELFSGHLVSTECTPSPVRILPVSRVLPDFAFFSPSPFPIVSSRRTYSNLMRRFLPPSRTFSSVSARSGIAIYCDIFPRNLLPANVFNYLPPQKMHLFPKSQFVIQSVRWKRSLFART